MSAAGQSPAVRPRALRGWAFVFACSLGAAMSAAKDAPTPLDAASLSAPVFTSFGAKDGLSDEIWTTIAFDGRGFAWAGSASSLARFDGYRWTLWPFPAARSLVRDMETDDQGNLWAIFEREGLGLYDGNRWSLVPQRPLFHQRFSDTRGADGTRVLWVNSERGFWRLVNGKWVEDEGNDSAPVSTAIRIEQTDSLFGEPRQWMASAGALWYRKVGALGTESRWRRFEEKGFDALQATDLKRSVDQGREELWILCFGQPLRRITRDGIRTWRASTGELPTEALYSALTTQTSTGERLLWISSRAGLLRIQGDRVTVFDRRHGLPADAVRGIRIQHTRDGADLLWVATEGGIARAALADSRWQTVSLLGARENGSFGVLLEPDGRGGEQLWVGSSKQGLGLLRRGGWRYFTRENGGLPDEGVRGIWRVTGPDEKPWRLLGLSDGGLYRIEDDLALKKMEVPWTGQQDQVAWSGLDRRIDGRRELWFAMMRNGIYRLSGGRWTHFMAAGAQDPWRVFGLVEQKDAAGRSWLWAASDQGLARFDGESWQLMPRPPGESIEGYRSVTLIRDETRTVLWAGSIRHGVVRLDVTDPARPVVLSGPEVPQPPDPTVYSIHADSVGRIYVCTNNGVQQLTPDANGRYAERVFRRSDGLVHDECNTNSQFVDSHDRYWVGTLGGLSVYDPRIQAAPERAAAKPLYFTDVRVDGQHHDPLTEPSIDVPAGAREVRVDFTLLAREREHESTYRSRLVGYEPAPGDWTSEHSRSFTGLPPGRYQFQVEARDFAGTAGTAGTLVFGVRPFWWQRTAARASFALIGLALAAGSVSIYNRRLRARQRQLESEVAARTADLDAANVRLTELSYLDALTGVANRRRLIEALDAAIDRGVALSLPVGIVVLDVDHFKAYNDRFGHLAGDAALRAVAQTLAKTTREQDLVARFGGEEFACVLQDAPLETVAAIAERMRTLVEALPPRALGNASQTITISAGILSRVPLKGERAVNLLEEADTALYEAKREGRNRVRSAPTSGAVQRPLP